MTATQRLFVFRSSSTTALHGFTHDSGGAKLPSRYSPWLAVGVVRPDQPAPHGLDRDLIDTGIASHGYQLWRKKKN